MGSGSAVHAPERPIGERSRPPIAGWATGEPWSPPPQREFRKPNCSSATAAASVTTARLTPLTRRAETAISSPTIVATEAPISREMGNFAQTPPTSVVRWDMVKPATPASASCTTEIWPTKPMMTTRERQMTMPSIELISACRKSYGKTISATTPSNAATTAGLSSRSGRGTTGSRFSTISPRPGRLAPRRKRARTMTRKTNSSDTPRSGAPPESVGNQLWVPQ